jgi:hypothetical protein
MAIRYHEEGVDSVVQQDVLRQQMGSKRTKSSPLNRAELTSEATARPHG